MITLPPTVTSCRQVSPGWTQRFTPQRKRDNAKFQDVVHLELARMATRRKTRVAAKLELPEWQYFPRGRTINRAIVVVALIAVLRSRLN